jgi:hypothetical protein
MTARIHGLGALLVITACASGNTDEVAGARSANGGSGSTLGTGPAPGIVDGSIGSACDDGIRNGSESDVDCGGSCAACDNGEDCDHDGDCSSGSCSAGACADPSCTDGKRNGNETGVDCGGGSCAGCGEGSECSEPTDCASGPCGDDVCCSETSYTLSTGFTSTGAQICCEGSDERTSVVDCGDGGDHWASPAGDNCAQAFEGSENYGGPCASVTCKKLSCGTADAGAETGPPR